MNNSFYRLYTATVVTEFFSHLTWTGFNPVIVKWKVPASLIQAFSSVKYNLKKKKFCDIFKHYIESYFKETLHLGLLIIFLTR